MFIVGILSWWYGPGWRERISIMREHVDSTMDFFSIGLLLKTLFSPFRQISAGKVNGPLAVQMRAFFDGLISRMIGGMIRSFMVIIGICAIILTGLIGCIGLILWAFVPLLPIFGIILWLSGWMPWIR
ncbi:MAG TPA: hypothetical protein VK497_01825 [Candidatus Saccharimonadales bacterium]|nr:hypothetical protein [Candidatus Saccharimonadales bacterium]